MFPQRTPDGLSRHITEMKVNPKTHDVKRFTPALAPPCVGGIVAAMKATFIILLALVVAVGCGKKEQPNITNASDKTPAKTEPAKESTLEDKVVGKYEYKEPG